MRKVILMGMVFLLLFPVSRIDAIEITNDSDHKMGILILQVLPERNAPVYFKGIEPHSSMVFEAEGKGPFIVSAADMQTKQTMRLEEVPGDAHLTYNGEELIVDTEKDTQEDKAPKDRAAKAAKATAAKDEG